MASWLAWQVAEPREAEEPRKPEALELCLVQASPQARETQTLEARQRLALLRIFRTLSSARCRL